MSSRVCYMAGQWLPEAEAKVSVYDLSVMQAAAAFEMTRSFGGKTFKLDEHLDRLENSCRLLGIPLALSKSALHAVCDEIVDRHRDVFDPADEHRLLIVASPGCAPMYRELEGVIAEPYVYVTDFPLRYTVAGMGKYFTDGVQCVVSQRACLSDRQVPSQAKHRARLHFHLAQQEAPAGTWPLMAWGRDSREVSSNMIEAPGANIVRVEDDTLFLHKQNALPGISMHAVEEIATQLGWRVRENEYDFMRGGYEQEIWLTGTPFCAIPVKTFNGKRISNSEEFPGPRYKRLMQAWSESVGVNIAEQIIGWEKRLL